ncbi:methyltransferase domain-containing protein [Streptomyces sp. NPDC051907]|uniref:class I SAM-dependent methyltransferase n=1 Tax=Streptomyces sp. NPDC051907 TaxID=3155284 RepID=UPI0034244389
MGEEPIRHLPPDTDDAFGHLLSRVWNAECKPGRVFEIIERSDGFTGACDAAEYFALHKQWPQREQVLLAEARGRVLDIGCGAGRHLLHLQQRGLSVMGVDSSPGAVELCEKQSVPAQLGTAHDLPCDDASVDTILALGANLGLLGGREQSLVTLREWARVAAPGARVLATSRDPYTSKGKINTDYHQANREAGRMAGQLRIRIRSGALATPYFDYLYLSLPELRELLVPTPWRLHHVIEDTGGGYGVVLTLKD